MLPRASQLVLFLFVFLLPLNAKAPRIICTLGAAANSYDAYADQRPTGDAMELARRVSAALVSSCSPNCASLVLFRNSTIPGAILVADPDRAKMVYSPQFFTSLYEKYGDGAIIAIIAHMLGHAIDATAPARWMNSSWAPEVRADAWAGCALANADLSQPGLQAALKSLSTYPSAAHPNWSQRIPALRVGYTQCGGTAAKFDKAAIGIQ